jgi:hypothetical protein
MFEIGVFQLPGRVTCRMAAGSPIAQPRLEVQSAGVFMMGRTKKEPAGQSGGAQQ